MAEGADILAPFLSPVSADSPTGEDLTYDEAYLRIRDEVDRMGTVSVHVDHDVGGGDVAGADFGAIAEEARALLAERTRDLQLAAYLVVSLSRSRAAEGLAEGLAITHALAETFGDAVHPIKPLRRRNALQFLADRSKEWLADRKFSADDADALRRAAAATEGLQNWAAGTMGDDAPALSGLRQAIDEALRTADKPPAPAGAAVPPAGATPTPPVGGESLALGSAADARRAVIRVASYLREQDPSSAVPFRLMRAISWAGLSALPTHENGNTQIDPPDAPVRSGIEAALSGADPMAGLRAVEDAFPSRPLWLDLQRFAAESAGRAGAPGRAIHDAIVADTRDLVGRLPGLLTLAFRDGTPLADDATRAWIGSLPSGDGGGAAAAATAAGDDPLAEALAEARALVASGDLDAAAKALQHAPAALRSGREHTRAGVHLARLLLQGGRPATAASLIGGLAEAADRRALDEWEPALALELWRTAHAAWTAAAAAAAAPAKEAAQRRAAEAYDRVARLDVAAALALPAGLDKKAPRG